MASNDDRDERARANGEPPRTGSSPDPVLFGPDPFADLPGGHPEDTDEEALPTRPTWPVVVLIVLVVVAIVGALGVWIR